MAPRTLFLQCGSDHMTRGRTRAVDRIVVHYTGGLASARNNAVYFSRNERQGASAHYFVDDISEEVYQSVSEGDTAWHAGNWDMNCRSIGIEVVSAGEAFSEVEVAKLAELVGALMGRYGIGASGVIRHYDVTGKRCPAPYVDDARWAALRARITGGSGGGAGTAGGGGSSGGGSGGVDVDELARAVIRGEYGNGAERRRRLGSSYDAVQRRVNQLLG